MVKALLLGLLAVTMCGIALAAPMPQLDLSISRSEEMPPTSPPQPPLVDQDQDQAARNERSTNLSHVTGTARKIQMFVKNRNLQILPDGTVNGTTDDTSNYTIFQRTTIEVGKMKIQGVFTCQYLCMDSCGLLYGSREFGDECIFNETMGKDHYNTYSSIKYSNDKRKLYLALNRRGQSRKVLLRKGQSLGRLSSYIRVLTRTVNASEESHKVRHHGHLGLIDTNKCPPNTPIDPPRCRKKKKRKKKKRKCHIGESDMCQKKPTTNRKLHNNNNNNNNNNNHNSNKVKKKCDNGESDECQRDLTINNNNNNKNNKNKLINKNNKKKSKKSSKKVKHHAEMTTTTEASIVADYVTPDEDYGLESTTHWEWEDSTAIPDMSMSLSSVSAHPD